MEDDLTKSNIFASRTCKGRATLEDARLVQDIVDRDTKSIDIFGVLFVSGWTTRFGYGRLNAVHACWDR